MRDVFLTNQSENNFLENLKNEIRGCVKFYFSVSFIKYAGLRLIERDLTDALERGVEGRIITSTYQNFTDIQSLQTFLSWSQKYPNFKVHLDYKCFGESGFHSKGYLFESNSGKSVFIGSSNITKFALLKNIEWNVMLLGSRNINTFDKAKLEFDRLWNKTQTLTENLIEKYRTYLEYALVKWDMDYYLDEDNSIKPNTMQKKALLELSENRNMGVKKTLVIAATGSGKTYLAAFDARNFDAQRLLFIVHRETILHDAKKTFEKVFGSRRTYGFYTGKDHDRDIKDKQFIFASSAMLSRHLDEFDPEEFDYIVYDEVHHIVADSGMDIFNHFKPDFLLGLTATPERLDGGGHFRFV